MDGNAVERGAALPTARDGLSPLRMLAAAERSHTQDGRSTPV